MKRCALSDISGDLRVKRQTVDQEDKATRPQRKATSQSDTSKYYEPGGALDSQTDSQTYVAEYYNQAGDTMYVGKKEQDKAAKATSPINTPAKMSTKVKREIEEDEENKLPMDLMDNTTRTIIDMQTQLRRNQDDLYTVRLKLQTLQRENADTISKQRKCIAVLTRDVNELRKEKEGFEIAKSLIVASRRSAIEDGQKLQDSLRAERDAAQDELAKLKARLRRLSDM